MRAVILARPGVQSLDVVGPGEVFWEAARRLGDPSAYEVQVMGTTAGAVCGTGNLRFLADTTIYAPDEPIDTLLVGGDPSFDEIDPAVTAWLSRRAPTVRRYGSVCTRLFFLSAPRLLPGPPRPPPWEFAGKFRNDFPHPLSAHHHILIP